MDFLIYRSNAALVSLRACGSSLDDGGSKEQPNHAPEREIMVAGIQENIQMMLSHISSFLNTFQLFYNISVTIKQIFVSFMFIIYIFLNGLFFKSAVILHVFTLYVLNSIILHLIMFRVRKSWI